MDILQKVVNRPLSTGKLQAQSPMIATRESFCWWPLPMRTLGRGCPWPPLRNSQSLLCRGVITTGKFSVVTRGDHNQKFPAMVTWSGGHKVYASVSEVVLRILLTTPKTSSVHHHWEFLVWWQQQIVQNDHVTAAEIWEWLSCDPLWKILDCRHVTAAVKFSVVITRPQLRNTTAHSLLFGVISWQPPIDSGQTFAGVITSATHEKFSAVVVRPLQDNVLLRVSTDHNREFWVLITPFPSGNRNLLALIRGDRDWNFYLMMSLPWVRLCGILRPSKIFCVNPFANVRGWHIGEF